MQTVKAVFFKGFRLIYLLHQILITYAFSITTKFGCRINNYVGQQYAKFEVSMTSHNEVMHRLMNERFCLFSARSLQNRRVISAIFHLL